MCVRSTSSGRQRSFSQLWRHGNSHRVGEEDTESHIRRNELSVGLDGDMQMLAHAFSFTQEQQTGRFCSSRKKHGQRSVRGFTYTALAMMLAEGEEEVEVVVVSTHFWQF